MRNRTLWRIIASGLLTVAAIAVVQTYWLVNSFSRAERTFDEKVHIALRHVAEQISQLTQVQLPSQKLITKISQDYYVVNIQDAINAQELEFFLRQELENLALQTDFEYGIYDCASDEMVYGNYIQYRPGERAAPNSNLERYDDYVYYFGVRFPDRKGYVLNSHWIPIAFTGLLFAAVLFFLYAVKEILKQRKLSDLQKDFINNMTHEFKTPLSSINISADVLLEHETIKQDPRLRMYAGIIQSQGEHLSTQVERVLQIADVRQGQITLEKQPVDMHELIETVIAEQIESNAKSNTIIEKELLANPSVVMCDRHHMTNILQNLLDNAIKYSADKPLIRVVTKYDKDFELHIIDQGIGIATEEIKKVTDQFYRVPTGNVHNAKGFGLGLHYVSKLCNEHGWDLKITSALGKGTTVSITCTS